MQSHIRPPQTQSQSSGFRPPSHFSKSCKSKAFPTIAPKTDKRRMKLEFVQHIMTFPFPDSSMVLVCNYFYIFSRAEGLSLFGVRWLIHLNPDHDDRASAMPLGWPMWLLKSSSAGVFGRGQEKSDFLLSLSLVQGPSLQRPRFSVRQFHFSKLNYGIEVFALGRSQWLIHFRYD